MSNTDFLRQSEADLLPPGFVHGHSFELCIGEYRGYAEVDGWHPARREAVEICQSETGGAPKAGQRRKMASDALKLIFSSRKDASTMRGCMSRAPRCTRGSIKRDLGSLPRVGTTRFTSS